MEKYRRSALRLSFLQWNRATFKAVREDTSDDINVRTNTPRCQPSRMPTMHPVAPRPVAQIPTQGINLFQWSPRSVRHKIMGTNEAVVNTRGHSRRSCKNDQESYRWTTDA